MRRLAIGFSQARILLWQGPPSPLDCARGAVSQVESALDSCFAGTCPTGYYFVM